MSFVMSPGLMGDEPAGLANMDYFSNPIISLKQYLSGLKATNCSSKNYFFLLELLNTLK